MENSSSNNSSSSFCSIHGKSIEYLCITCTSLLCPRCVVAHNSHNLQDVDSLSSHFDTNNNNNNIINNNNSNNNNNSFTNLINNESLTNRMNELWSKLKLNVQIHQNLLNTENRMQEFYLSLQQYIQYELNKMNETIRVELLKTQQTVTSIINEIKSLNSIIKSFSMECNLDTLSINDNSNINSLDFNSLNLKNVNKSDNSNNSNENNNSLNIQTIINNINKTDNLSQFIKEFKSTIFSTDNNKNNKNINNHSLTDSLFNLNIIENQQKGSLELICQYLKSYGTVNYELSKSISVRFNQKMINEVKAKLPLCYDFVNDQQLIFSFGSVQDNNNNTSTSLTEAYIFDPVNTLWSKIPVNNNENSRIYTMGSVVQAGAYVYVFGGTWTSNSFSRYSLDTQRWDNSGPIVKLGSNVAACFNGVDVIYLLCGSTLVEYNIDSNIATECEHVIEWFGESPVRRYLFPFYFDGAVYVFLVDGSIDMPVQLLRLDIKTYQSVILSHRFDGIRSACFDAESRQLYVLDSNFNFYRFGMSTGERVILKALSLPRQAPAASMVLLRDHQTSQPKIYLLHGGKQFGNYKYMINTNDWLVINDGDNSTRYDCGACTINNRLFINN